MNSALRFRVAPVARISRIRFIKEEKLTLQSLLYCQFRLCITTVLFWAAAKADAGKARTPLLKKIGENNYEKTNEN